MFNPRKFTPVLLALGLAASPLGLAGAMAQDAAPAPQPAPTQPAQPMAPAVDDAKLQSFVVAFLEVNKVGQQYQPQIEAAGDDAERTRIQEEASQKMVEAVEGSGGISVQEYSTILTTAQSDPELASQINAKIQENVGGAAPADPAQPAQPAPAQ